MKPAEDSPPESGARPPALFLAPEAPYPLAGGGALRTASLLAYLGRRYALDVIVFRPPEAPEPVEAFPPRLARNVHSIPLPRHSRRTVARAFRNSARLLRGVPPLLDRFAGFGPDIARLTAGQHYSLSIIEHFWCAPYWQQIAACSDATVLDLHNIESVLHRRCAEAERGFASLAHHSFSGACLALERQWLPRFSRLLVTSERDAEWVRRIAPGRPIDVYPNTLPPVALPSIERSDAIVFSGNLEYHPNVSAVRYFRQEVWPALRLRWPGLVWRLVGKNPDAVRKYTAGDSRIQLTGPVADSIPEIARAKAAIVPLRAGSGTRFKILEAWAAGLPVVSTPLGAEGLPVEHGKNILLAENSNSFAEAVSRLLASEALRERLGTAGRALFEREFTWEAGWNRLNL